MRRDYELLPFSFFVREDAYPAADSILPDADRL